MILSHVINAVRAWQRYRTCVNELNLLNDRELADIGLTRSNIPWVAWHSAQDFLAGTKPAKPRRDR